MKTLIELRSDYGRLMTQAQEISKAGFTSESRTQFDRVVADADAIFADIQREERMAKFTSEQNNAQRPPRAGFGNDDHSEVRAQAQKDSFFHWMRTGEKRDLGAGAIAGSITGGSVLVPTTMGPFIQAKKNIGQLVYAVNSFNTSGGGPITIPTANDSANGLVLTSEASAVSTETDPSIGSVVSHTDTATSNIVKISNELLEDAGYDLSAWLNDVLSTRYVRGLAKWVSQGNGSNVAALASVSGATSAAPTSVSYADLVALYGSLDAAYVENASWVMSSATRANLLTVNDSFGHPLLQLTAGVPNTSPFSSIFGRPIVIDESAPAIAATNKAIVFGDLKEGYTLRTVGSFAVKRLNELFSLSNETAFVLFARVSGVNTDAGTHPIKALTQHA